MEHADEGASWANRANGTNSLRRVMVLESHSCLNSWLLPGPGWWVIPHCLSLGSWSWNTSNWTDMLAFARRRPTFNGRQCTVLNSVETYGPFSLYRPRREKHL